MNIISVALFFLTGAKVPDQIYNSYFCFVNEMNTPNSKTIRLA